MVATKKVSKFFEEIKCSVIEREVERVYNKGITMYFQNTNIEHPFACDGFIDTKTDNNKMVKLIIEYKFNEDLNSSVTRAKVLTQVLYYLKRFEQNGLILPNVLMVGDLNECFVLHTNDLINYLDENVDWTIAPSKAHMFNPELIKKISENDNINPFIFKIDETFSFKTVVDKIKDLADNIQRYVHVTEHNIAKIFEYFSERVIKNKKKIAANDLVAIFLGTITDKENYYLHPVKKNVLVTPMGEIQVNGDGFKSFFQYFNRNYTPQEKNRFAEISDRLIEDTNRRNKGEFYTPTLFVDYAHKRMEQAFGEDWKEKFVVWDNCCGSKNLTRDYHFSNLYCSTLEDAELEISKRYNTNAVSFQYDFLNDSLDKLPKSLIEHFENNAPIIFFINPPYATSGNQKLNEEKKTGVAVTMVNEIMKTDNIGASSQNLYAQFLYRIIVIKKHYKLTNVHIGLFSPTLYLSGGSFKGFRNSYLKDFTFNNGIVFQASHFADVASNWGISFTIWNTNINETITNEFTHDLVDSIDGEIEIVGEKNIYNTDNEISASDWAKNDVKKLKTFDYPCLSSGIKIREKNSRGRNFENALGFFNNCANKVEKNAQEVALFSTSYGNGNGHGLSKDNFTKCTALFTARRVIDGNWSNWQDEYLKPNTGHIDYKRFETDSVVYALFESKSNQSSLRNVEYKGKSWDIVNEFFFMSREEMMRLANENNNDFCYNDALSSKDRFVNNFISEHIDDFSEDAINVLNKAIELTRKSFPYREMFNNEHPEYQINNWDCGWYQIKALLKEYFPNDLKEFNQLFKKLSEKMRPMVYDLGFLKN